MASAWLASMRAVVRYSVLIQIWRDLPWDEGEMSPSYWLGLVCISNYEVCRCIDLPSLTHIIRTTRLKFFGHIAQFDPSMDHIRALRSSVDPLPRDWNHRSGRPRQTWLRTVESEINPHSICLATAYYRAQNRQTWRCSLICNVYWTSHMMMIIMFPLLLSTLVGRTSG